MTDFKKRTLHLMTGKQIRLYGNSMAIGSTLEVGEGSAPNIFSFLERDAEPKKRPEIMEQNRQEGEKTSRKTSTKKQVTVQNPHQLTESDLLEIADYNIQLWQDLKKNIRRHGVNDPKVFNQDATR